MPIIVQLDRPREVRWSLDAAERFASLKPRPPWRDVMVPARRQAAVCGLLWAALVDADHPFPAPDALGDYLVTDDQIAAGIDAVRLMIETAFGDQPPRRTT
jgi:hypothetical protein